MRPIESQFPLEPEVSFDPCVRIRRDDGDEKRARPDLLADRCIPRISATQLALVEPYFDAGGAQCGADCLSGLGVFGRIAKEDSSWATRWCRDAIEPWFIGQGRAVRRAIRVRGGWTTQAWRANREGYDLLSACIGSPYVILRADFA